MPLQTCPVCEVAMEVTSYEDVLMDVCPSCRGAWLDRGELQKIIAHVRREEEEYAGLTRESERPRDHREDDSWKKDKKGKKGKRKKRFWEALEDMIDLD